MATLPRSRDEASVMTILASITFALGIILTIFGVTLMRKTSQKDLRMRENADRFYVMGWNAGRESGLRESEMRLALDENREQMADTMEDPTNPKGLGWLFGKDAYNG